jgi:hypothetical protein
LVARRSAYDAGMPRLWLFCIVILVACCLASMVIALVKLY